MIASDQFAELISRIGERARVFPLNGPIDRNLLPQQQTHFVCRAGHIFIMRIVREACEIAAEFFRPREQQARILNGGSPAAAQGIFFMDGNAAQKNRLAI